MSGPSDIDLNSGIAAFEAKQFANAMRLLHPHAELGDPEAQYRVAIMCQNGLGVLRNELLAFKWMRAAAEQGFGLAQHGLGFMYLEGDCVERSDKDAFRWFSAAADQGLAGAQLSLAMMYEEGRGVDVDTEKAKALYAQAGIEQP